MRHWPRVLLTAACLAAAAAPVQAETDEMDYLSENYGTLDKSGSKRLLNVIRDLDGVLGEDPVAHLAPIAEFFGQHSYLTGAPLLDGLVALDLDRRPDAPASAVFSLYFADNALRDQFHHALVNAFGEPDPACRSETASNWSPEAGRSIAWRAMNYGVPVVDLTIKAADPNDANCARSASPQSQLLNEADMAAFLQRLRDEPPPFENLKAFRQWLQPYGAMEVHNGDSCYTSVIMPPTEAGGAPMEGLGGVNFLMANLHNCTDVDYGLSYLSLSSYVDLDMFAADKFARVADAALGTPIKACSDEYQTAWSIDDETTLIISDSYLSFVAMVYRAPPSLLGCG